MVSIEELVRFVWDDPPATARRQVRNRTTALRRLLVAAGFPPGVIVAEGHGFALHPARAAVDVVSFHHCLDQARARRHDDTARAVVLLREALSQWHGPALAGLEGQRSLAAAARLDELRRSAWEQCFDLELRHGRHHEVLAELADVVGRYPAHEPFVAQLMLALYRSGRQVDALRRYADSCRYLADEFGVDPGSELRDCFERILRNDPSLLQQDPDVEIRPGPDPRDQIVTAAADPGDQPAALIVPHQLPARPRLFTGRSDEIAYLDAAARDVDDRSRTVVVSAIGGAGGTGKTCLALHWANANLDLFPDGQLYADLRGFGPDAEPASPATLVRTFLEAFGVNANNLPADEDGQAALYRSLAAGRRMLIMLDNARNSAQVEPLIPGGSTCTVLVTSRNQLAGLAVTQGAHRLVLDVMPESEAWDLLTDHLGQERLAGEFWAAAAIVDYCAGLPLALGIAAARAAVQTHLPLRSLAQELRDTTARLDAFDAGDLKVNLRAVLSWSYQALSADEAEVFGLLGLVSSGDIGLPAAASLTARPMPRVRELLRRLTAASLVSQPLPGRYRLHDLVRLYAAEQVNRRGPAVRQAALRRLIDYYLHTAYAADRALDPRRPPVELDPSAPGCVPHRAPDAAEAMTWFDLEHSHLIEAQRLAVAHGWHRSVWQLARTLVTFHARRRHPSAVVVWRAGAAAADREGEPEVRAMAYRFLGQACSLSQLGESFDHLRTALRWAERVGDTAEQARAHYALNVSWYRRGELRYALKHADQALRLFQQLGEPVEEARALNAIGWLHAHLGQFEEGQEVCERALELIRRHHHPDVEADTVHTMGYLAQHTGRHTEALARFGQALEMYQRVDSTRGEVDSLTSLGEVYTSIGRHAEAREVMRRRMDLLHAQHRFVEAAGLQDRIADSGSG
ncbi:BTAD domain-containing putative transcriptional regulator [Micromonospora sp. CA-246542]|uniref:AfsR/SARP family transcriptional regulator n=1 Tax=Micromonospora sp. CA-246542 TaxID=3239959 RepID=UPI003D94CD01